MNKHKSIEVHYHKYIAKITINTPLLAFMVTNIFLKQLFENYNVKQRCTVEIR